MKEQIGWSLISVVLAVWLPVFVVSAWAGLEANTAGYRQGFGVNPIGSIGAFMWLIFVAPLTTLGSVFTGILGFRQSKRAGRALAIGSFVITATGLVLLMLFVAAIRTPATL